jgi:TRAP transporter TAXI family solute receptor
LKHNREGKLKKGGAMREIKNIRKNCFLRTIASLMMLCIFSALAFGEEVIDIGSGSVTGTYYPFAVGIAKVLNDKLENVKVQAHSTKGSGYNNEKMYEKELEMAMMQNDVAFYAYEGLESIVLNKKLRAIGTLYPEDIHIVVRKDSGIRSLKDMIGKRIAIGNEGSGQRRNSVQILETEGILAFIKKDDAEFDLAVEKLKKGEIDGLFYTVGWPAKGLVDLVNEEDCSFVSLDKSTIQRMVSDFPFYVESFIPKGTYHNLNTDIKTIAVKASLVVREDLEDSLVYAMTKVIFENLSFLKTTHKKWENVGIMKSRLGVGIPFHDGAEEYFKRQVVAVRKKPYSMAPTIGYVNRGMKLKIYTDKWNMSKITTITGEKGWVPGDQITDKKEGKHRGFKVKAQNLNFRKAPSLKNTPIRILEKDDVLERIGQQKVLKDDIKWIHVRLENGEVGWVSSSSKYVNEYQYTGYTGVVKPPAEGQESPLQIRAQKWLKSE